jgi:hypothetical protein
VAFLSQILSICFTNLSVLETLTNIERPRKLEIAPETDRRQTGMKKKLKLSFKKTVTEIDDRNRIYKYFERFTDQKIFRDTLDENKQPRYFSKIQVGTATSTGKEADNVTNQDKHLIQKHTQNDQFTKNILIGKPVNDSTFEINVRPASTQKNIQDTEEEDSQKFNFYKTSTAAGPSRPIITTNLYPMSKTFDSEE